MQNLPKAITISLAAKQTIAELMPPNTGNVIIKAGTGTGKTWFTFYHLMLKHRVVLLCPTVAQVEQCEATYADVKNCHFIHGGKKISTAQYKTLAQHNLVMTYDQYPKFREYLDDKTVLVVDEGQKLYSVGQYREKAIQPIISDLVGQKYKLTYLLTATFTECIFEQLNIPIQHYFHFTPANSIQRQITIINYEHPHPLQWYKNVLKRLNQNRQAGEDKLIIVRLNDINFCKRIRLMLEHEGFSAMLINRHEMQGIDCTKMLRNEQLDQKYQVVLCSSVLDEAINLNNPNDEVDSIHFVGQHAHPEEMTQFIGRMRQANPPIYIHLPAYTDQGNAKACTQLHRDLSDDMFNNLNKVLHLLENQIKPLFAPEQLATLGKFSRNKIDSVRSLNTITTEMIGCNGFWETENGEIEINHASLIAQLFQTDKFNAYTDIAYLSYRLKQHIPCVNIRTIPRSSTVSEQLIAQFKQSKEELHQAKIKAVDQVKVDIINEINDAASFPIQRHLDQYHSDQSNPYDNIVMEAHHQVFDEMIKLRSTLTNLEDMGDAIKNERVSKVLSISHQYQYHPIVKPIMTELAKAFKDPEFLDARHSYTDITKKMNRWLAKIDKNLPIAKLLKEHPLNHIENNGHDSVRFSEGGSILFLKRYSHIKIFNNKKPIEQKKIEFLNLAAYGYQYHVLPESHSSKRYTLVQGVKYDACTGRKQVRNNRNGGFAEVELD